MIVFQYQNWGWACIWIKDKTKTSFIIVVISPMTECGCMVAMQMSTLTYPSLKPGGYSFMHSMSWACRPGGAHPSLGQTTVDVLKFEGSLWSQTHWPLIPLNGGGPSALTDDLSLGCHLSSNAMSSPHWQHI